VIVRLVAAGVGPITISDIELANTTKSQIIAFNVKPAGSDAVALARGLGVQIQQFDIIYSLVWCIVSKFD